MGFAKSRYNQIKMANLAAQPDGSTTDQSGPPIKIEPGGSITVPAGTTLTMGADGTLLAKAGPAVKIIPISIAQAYQDHIKSQGQQWKADTTAVDATNLYNRLVAHCVKPVDVAAKQRDPATAKQWRAFYQLTPITNFCDLTREHFLQFLALLKLEPISKRGYGIRFITLLNWAIQNRYILRETGEQCINAVWVKRADAVARKVVPLTFEQFGMVMDDLNRRLRKGKKNAFRDMMIIRLAHNMCLRTSDIRRLKIKDVDLSHMSMDLLRKGDKRHWLKIDVQDLQEDMQEYVEFRRALPNVPTDPNSPLFLFKGHAPTAWNVYSVVSKTLRRCGIYRSLKKGGHLLRATGALYRLKSGMMNIREIQELLCHKSVATTEIYLNISNEEADMMLENRYTEQRLMRERSYGRGYAIQR